MTTVQGTGVHATVADVRGRLEMLAADVKNPGALSLAWPAIVSWVTVDLASSVVNCTYADVMTAGLGICTFWNRIPTTWLAEPSGS